MKIENELYCRSCEQTIRTEHREDECPNCHNEDIHNNSFIICTCGTTVYLDSFTNECDGCEKLYNNFGQELAPVEEWEEEDRYACYGPQNYNEDY